MITFEIGENRAPRFGMPDRHSEWPVIVNGREVAEIIETEHGYRLREGDGWLNDERPFRSQAEDDARNRYLTWVCMQSHPWSSTRYEEAECNGETWSRVTVGGEIALGPEIGTEKALAEFWRRYNKATKEENG